MVATPKELVGQTEFPGIGELKFYTNSGPIYAPSQEICGTIEFRCVRPILLVRGVWIKLVGRQSVNVGTVNAQVDLFEGHEEHYLGGFHEVLYGYGEENVDNGGAATLFELREGIHRWNFALKIPENAPPSYFDQFTEISYEATAVFDTPEVLMLASTLTYTPIIVILPTPLTSKSNQTSQLLRVNDICLLGDRPSVSFQSMRPPSSTLDLLLCSSSKRRADPKPFTNSDVAAILDTTGTRNTNNSTAAHTVLRVAMTDPSMSSSSDHHDRDHSTKASFDFTFVDTNVKVDCTLATMCAGKPVSLEARLLVCVLLRSSSSRPFHSLRSLLQAPHSQVPALTAVNPAAATADMAASSSSSSSGHPSNTIQMHVRSTNDSVSASDENTSLEKRSLARRWLQRLGRLTRPSSSSSPQCNFLTGAETKEEAAAGWGACSVHQLWSRVVVLQTSEQPMAPMAVPLEVPVKIDPTLRSSCLSDWPRPSPLPHHASHGAILHFTSRTTTNTGDNAVGQALFEYRVVLEVAAFELKGDLDAVYSSGGDAVGAWEHRRGTASAKSPLCRPCYAEIEVRAPPPSNNLMTTMSLPTLPPVTVSALAATVAGVPEASAVVAPAAAAVQLLPPRQPSSSSGHPRFAPTDSNNNSINNSSSNSNNNSSSGLGIAEGGLLVVGGRARIRSGSVAPEQPPPQQIPSSSVGGSAAVSSSSSRRAGHTSDTENQNPNTSSTRDRDHNPALIAAKVGVIRSNGGRGNHPATKKHKPLTPQARPVKSVSRVTAELVSRGPAAVLRDRTAPVHRDIQITPSRFAPAVPVAQGAVVVLDDYLNNNNNNNNNTAGNGDSATAAATQGARTSTTVTAMCTPRSNSSGHESTAITPSVFSPTAPAMSPALAFLCSPRTTEMLLEEEDRAAAAADTPLSVVRGSGIGADTAGRDSSREYFEYIDCVAATATTGLSPRYDHNISSSSSSSMCQYEAAVAETETTTSSVTVVVAQLQEEEEEDQEAVMAMSSTSAGVVTLDDLPCSLGSSPLASHTVAMLLSSSSVPVLREGIPTISTPSAHARMATALSLSSVGPQTRTAAVDNGCCYVPLPFLLPPDSAPPTARLTARLGHNDDEVMTTAGLPSPWTDSALAEVHFTQNGRRLSFSNRESEQLQPQQQPDYDNTMVVSEFLPLFGSPIALT